MKSKILGLLAVGLLSTAMHAEATVLYAEGNDLTGNLASPEQLGNLTLGLNTVSGSILGRCGVFDGRRCKLLGDNADSFSFVISEGLTLVSATFTITDYSATGFPRSAGRSSSDLLTVDFSGNVAGVNVLPNFDIFGTQSFQLISTYNSADESSSYGWQLDLVTQSLAVPEPGTLALLGLGLLGLGVSRRRA